MDAFSPRSSFRDALERINTDYSRELLQIILYYYYLYRLFAQLSRNGWVILKESTIEKGEVLKLDPFPILNYLLFRMWECIQQLYPLSTLGTAVGVARRQFNASENLFPLQTLIRWALKSIARSQVPTDTKISLTQSVKSFDDQS